MSLLKTGVSKKPLRSSHYWLRTLGLGMSDADGSDQALSSGRDDSIGDDDRTTAKIAPNRRGNLVPAPYRAGQKASFTKRGIGHKRFLKLCVASLGVPPLR
jgi:hypothetical protein